MLSVLSGRPMPLRSSVRRDDTSGEHALRPSWIAWMRDYAAAARRFVAEDSIEVASEEERELVAIRAALYARALTLFEGALLLIENDRQLDFRIQSRGVIEATMYLIALDRNPDFVTRMKDDDFKSRQSRAALHLGAKNLLAPKMSDSSSRNLSRRDRRARKRSSLAHWLRVANSIASTAAIETSREMPHMSA